MTDQISLLLEAERRGILPADRAAVLAEARRRGLIGDNASVPSDVGAVEGLGKGFVRGVRDVIDAGAQMIPRAIEAVAPAGSGLESWARGQAAGVDEINAAAERDYRDNWLRGGDPTSAIVGRVAGNVAGSVPIAAAVPGAAAPSLAGRVASGAAGGALTGAFTPVQESDTAKGFWSQKAEDMGAGAIGGAAAPVVAAPFRRFFARRSPETQAMMAAGVRPTPGQIMGGMAGRTESAAESIPLLGDAIRSAKRAANDQFNRGAINRALSHIGEKLPDDAPLGREAIEEAGKKISAAYDEIIPKLSARPDGKFMFDLQATARDVRQLPESLQSVFGRVVDDEIGARVKNAGNVLDGETLKLIESRFGQLAAKYRGSSVASERELGDAFMSMRDNVRGMVSRQNPQASELRKVDRAYAEFLRVENAATRAGQDTAGVFSPSQLNAATRQMDSSGRKRQFAHGDALMQDYAEAGLSALGRRVPDSGTALRLMVGAGALGGAGYFGSPEAAALGGLAALPYLPGARTATAHILASRGPTTEAVSRAFESAVIPATGARLSDFLVKRDKKHN